MPPMRTGALLAAGMLVTMTAAAQSPAAGKAYYVRLVNAIPEEPAIDLTAGAHLIVSGQAFGTASGYVPMDGESGSYHIGRHADGKDLEDQRLSFAAGGRYTLVAMPGPDGDVRLVVLPDAPGPGAGMAQVSVLSAALPPARLDVRIGVRQPARFDDVANGAAPAWRSLAPTTATVEIRQRGSDSAAVELKNMRFQANRTYIIVITCLPNAPLKAFAFSDSARASHPASSR